VALVAAVSGAPACLGGPVSRSLPATRSLIAALLVGLGRRVDQLAPEREAARIDERRGLLDEGLEITATCVGSETRPVLTCELSGSATAPDPEEALGSLGSVSTFLPMSSESGIFPNTGRIFPNMKVQVKSNLCIPSE